jgi:hypothetical protein
MFGLPGLSVEMMKRPSASMRSWLLISIRPLARASRLGRLSQTGELGKNVEP